jgi:spore maturation protein SpmB
VILEAGRSAVELTLFILLPVMVVMMAVMRVLEAKRVLEFVARLLAPVLRPFGVPGIGVFAMLQMLLVSFAAPATTLGIMERRETRRRIAATLAMILTMSQANAVFPLLTVGLSLPLVLGTSLVGGLVAAGTTYYLFSRRVEDEIPEPDAAGDRPDRPTRFVPLLLEGGQQGVQLTLNAIPSLVLAVFALEAIAAMGAIPALERGLAPLFEGLGLPGVSVLPLATKYLAGGTAMMGVVIDLIDAGSMTAADLNRLAGVMINPLDLVGLAVLCPAGSRVSEVKWPALGGAAVGILLRGVLHLLFG